LVFPVCCFGLARDYVGRTGAFSALSDLELNLLTFLETGVPGGLDFRVMNEQVIAASIGGDKAKALFPVKPFYYTCAHYCAPSAFYTAINFVSRIFLKRAYSCEAREHAPLAVIIPGGLSGVQQK